MEHKKRTQFHKCQYDVDFPVIRNMKICHLDFRFRSVFFFFVILFYFSQQHDFFTSPYPRGIISDWKIYHKS